MADTRCANPKYQVDVDVMSLEYTLYKAIQSHIRSFELTVPLLENGTYTRTISLVHLDQTNQLLRIFDALRRLFKRNHPNQKVKEETEFNITLLQFLFLFNQWLVQSFGNNDSVPTLDVSSRRLQSEALSDRGYRRHWLRLRMQQESLTDLEDIPSLVARDYDSSISLANNLLPRFLRVSEEISHNAGEGSDKWMRLATGFMLQAAIERFYLLEEDIRNATDVASWRKIETDLLECFAWGYVSSNSKSNHREAVRTMLDQSGLVVDKTVSAEISEMADVEKRIQGLFRTTDEHTADESDSIGNFPLEEIPEWTQSRKSVMQEVLLTLSSLKEAHPDERSIPIEILRRNMPLSTLLEDLVYFIDNIWSYLHSPDMYGKPVLIQIEEGKLDGFSDSEFAKFKRDVGL